MQNGRDSSLWRSLAVAFGDGLAFGVGVKLAQNAPGKTAALPEAEVAGRLAEIERRMERAERVPGAVSATGAAGLDQQALEALVSALDARLKENAAYVDRRLADLQAKIALELKSLYQQDESLASATRAEMQSIQAKFDEQVTGVRRAIGEDSGVLEAKVVSLHREFASAVANIVEEQVAGHMEAMQRTIQEQVAGAVESSLAQRVSGIVAAQIIPIADQLREEIRRTTALASVAEEKIESRLEPLRDQIGARSREIAELRQRVTEKDGDLLEVILGLGDLCRRVGRKTSASPEPSENAASPTAAAAQVAGGPVGVPRAMAAEAAAESDSELPGFAQPKKSSGLLRIPLVSSLILTAGGFFLLHYW